MKSFLLTLVLLASHLMIQAQEVQIETNYPEFCKSGDPCRVDITITKGDIQGFARVQQMLPEGFTATLIEDGGSDFIFDKQKVSFIWLSIPAASTVTVSYTLSPQVNMAGAYTIEDGTFSYLVDNKITRKTIPGTTLDINKRTSKVSKEPVIAMTEEKPEKPEIKETPVPKDPLPAEIPPLNTDTTPSREVPPQVSKKEPIPIEKNPSVQTEAPSTPKAAHPTSDEAPKPKEAEVEKTTIPAEPAKVTKPEPSKITEKPASELPKSKEVISEKTPDPVTPPVSEITFRVQFAALKTFREISQIQKDYNIPEKVYHESDGTWHRYTFGSWDNATEASAASKSFQARTGVSSYVVKFRNGKRI